MNAREFVGILFTARDVAHSVHLNTRSYAKHMALDSFYHGIIDLADKFAEAYQGRNGLLGQITPALVKTRADISGFLANQLAEIDNGRAEITTDSALQNIIDEIVGLYLATIYKLKFLA